MSGAGGRWLVCRLPPAVGPRWGPGIACRRAWRRIRFPPLAALVPSPVRVSVWRRGGRPGTSSSGGAARSTFFRLEEITPTLSRPVPPRGSAGRGAPGSGARRERRRGSGGPQAKGFAPIAMVQGIQLKVCPRPGEEQRQQGVRAWGESNGPGNFTSVSTRTTEANRVSRYREKTAPKGRCSNTDCQPRGQGHQIIF